MSGMPVEEILERLSARVGKPAAVIRCEMELYLEEMMRQDTQEVRRLKAVFQGRKMTLGDYLGLMAQEMELEREKEELP